MERPDEEVPEDGGRSIAVAAAAVAGVLAVAAVMALNGPSFLTLALVAVPVLVWSVIDGLR